MRQRKLTKTQIKGLSRMKYVRECVICFDDFKLQDRMLAGKCGHAFHEDCVSEPIKKGKVIDCPLCRKNLASGE